MRLIIACCLTGLRAGEVAASEGEAERHCAGIEDVEEHLQCIIDYQKTPKPQVPGSAHPPPAAESPWSGDFEDR